MHIVVAAQPPHYCVRLYRVDNFNLLVTGAGYVYSIVHILSDAVTQQTPQVGHSKHVDLQFGSRCVGRGCVVEVGWQKLEESWSRCKVGWGSLMR